MAPIEENKPAASRPPRGGPRPPSPGAVSRGFDGSPSTFDDPLLDDIDVDALVKQRQNSLPPAGANPNVSPAFRDPSRRGDAPAAPETAAAPPLDGSGFEWRCEHGCALRSCAFLAAHARALGDVLLEVEFQLSDEDVVMSNKERRVLEARRAEGAEIVKPRRRRRAGRPGARGRAAAAAPRGMPPPPGAPRGSRRRTEGGGNMFSGRLVRDGGRATARAARASGRGFGEGFGARPSAATASAASMR